MCGLRLWVYTGFRGWHFSPYCSYCLASSMLSLNVLLNAISLYLRVHIERRWNRCSDSCGSPVAAVTRRSNSVMRSRSDLFISIYLTQWLHGYGDEIARCGKVYTLRDFSWRDQFIRAFCSRPTCNCCWSHANVGIHVWCCSCMDASSTSCIWAPTLRPRYTRVSPSDVFPSVLRRPGDFLEQGMSAL